MRYNNRTNQYKNIPEIPVDSCPFRRIPVHSAGFLSILPDSCSFRWIPVGISGGMKSTGLLFKNYSTYSQLTYQPPNPEKKHKCSFQRFSAWSSNPEIEQNVLIFGWVCLVEYVKYTFCT